MYLNETRLERHHPGELQPAQGLDGRDKQSLAEGGGEEGRGLCVLWCCVGLVGVWVWVRDKERLGGACVCITQPKPHNTYIAVAAGVPPGLQLGEPRALAGGDLCWGVVTILLCVWWGQVCMYRRKEKCVPSNRIPYK